MTLKKPKKIEVTIKITQDKAITIGKVVMFDHVKYKAVGMKIDSIVFAAVKPKDITQFQVLIYSIKDLVRFYNYGILKGMEDC